MQAFGCRGVRLSSTVEHFVFVLGRGIQVCCFVLVGLSESEKKARSRRALCCALRHVDLRALGYLPVEALWDFDGNEPVPVRIKLGEDAVQRVCPGSTLFVVFTYAHDSRLHAVIGWCSNSQCIAVVV